jgi:hypothetical protein
MDIDANDASYLYDFFRNADIDLWYDDISSDPQGVLSGQTDEASFDPNCTSALAMLILHYSFNIRV